MKAFLSRFHWTLLALSLCVPLFARLPDNYRSLTAERKISELFNRVVEGAYGPLDWPSLGSLEVLRNLDVVVFPHRLRESITWDSDELPASRRGIKVFHTYGATALCEFIADEGSPYTGILRGAKGLMRFSYAGNPALIGNVPGLGLKFPVSGGSSRDLVVMHGLDSQGENTSVFQETFSNILPAPAPTNYIMRLVGYFFQKVSADGKALVQGLDHLGDTTQAGGQEANGVAPYQLLFVPSETGRFKRHSRRDFRRDLLEIAPDTELYIVYAKKDENAEPVRVGRLLNSSRFVVSRYGDKRFFIKHSARFLRAEPASCQDAVENEPTTE